MRRLGFALLNLSLMAQQDTPEAQRNPFARDAGAVTAGKALYDRACQSCHGPAGSGDRGPALTGTLRRGDADGMIFTNIRSGIAGTQMPSFSAFSTEQIWQLVSYIRSLAAVIPDAPKPELVKGDPQVGKVVFESKGGCLSCHQVNGSGTAVGPDLSNAGRLSAQALQAKIVNPNQPAAAPAPGRGGRNRRGTDAGGPATVTLKTIQGQQYRGVRRNEDSVSVQMVDSSGQYHSFDKAELAEIRVDTKSLMPDDFSSKLSADEIGNVVAWLKTLNGSATLSSGGLSWERIRDSDREPQNWLSYWGDLGGRHFSALKQITPANVKGLQARWAVQMPGDGIVESVPVVVDGIMYTTGPVGGSAAVFALDARTGRQLWRYDRRQKVTNPYETNRVNRGVTVLGNRVFFGTLDCALIALDARTGVVLWETQVEDTMKGYSITSPPLPLKDKIITGVAGGEYGIRGFIDAYDPATGKRLWRFYAIPAKGEPGNETWERDSWEHGSGGTWLTGSYDAESNTLFWTVGNPGPDINQDVRKGDNLYTCSVIALDPESGKLKWHYQFTPNDSHDWDSTEDVVIVDRLWHGQPRKLLLHADRNGVFYVLDRTNGKFLSATPFVRASWVRSWDENGRPILAPNNAASATGNFVYPSLGGGTNFQAPSYSPLTGLFYTVYRDSGGRFTYGPAPYEPGRLFNGRGGGFAPPPAPVPGQPRDSQGIMAIDPETGKARWKFELMRADLQPGVLATGGGVVFVATSEGNFLALDAGSGALLWHFNAGASIPSSPMSYSIDGTQYVAVSSANVLYSFALGIVKSVAQGSR
jgi:PQQ-dependent dehydrogenase (methanol/ethanol family)